MRTSWKTTFGGIVAALGGALLLVPDTTPVGVHAKPYAQALIALGTAIVGLSARDNNVTSEQVGAVKRNNESDN